MNLRAACIHGRYDKFHTTATRQLCPGGREVTVDYEAGITAWWLAYGSAGQYNPATRAAIAAAIGDTDDWDNQPEGYEHMATRQNRE